MRDLKTQLVRYAKWSVCLTLAHYACTWLSLIGWFVFMGHIDQSRSAAREAIAVVMSRTHDIMLHPLAHSFRGESNGIAHLRVLLNSLLWGTVAGTVFLIGRSHRRKRVGT